MSRIQKIRLYLIRNQVWIFPSYWYAKLKHNKAINKFYSQMIVNPILIYVFVFMVSSIIVISFTTYYFEYNHAFLENLLVEAHGVLFDILVIGIFVHLLNKNSDKYRQNQKYKDAIDDLRGIQNIETSRKIVRLIRKLNMNKAHKIDLSNCYLKGENLTGIKLSGANLNMTNFENAILRNVDFSAVDMRDSIVKNVSLENARLAFTNLSFLDFSGCNLAGTKFSSCEYNRTKFSGANMQKSSLAFENLLTCDFEKTDLRGADLAFSKITSEQLKNAQL